MTWIRRNGFRLGLGLVLILGLAISIAALITHRRIKASLPLLDGEVLLSGLTAPVTIARDSQGVPTIHGGSQRDLAQGMGWLHAQDRFFQMDMLRRAAAGELAALLGERLLTTDQEARLFQFRKRAGAVVAGLSPVDRELLHAYMLGVNQGLRALEENPFEYMFLSQKPEPWQMEDSVLVVYALYLQSEGGDRQRESTYATLFDVLPEALANFLTRGGSDYEAPLDDLPLAKPAIPGPEVATTGDTNRSRAERASEAQPNPGSNAWAVAGSRTVHGDAILANDMHLQLSLPNIWYRARTERTTDGSGDTFTLTGISLPGMPGIVVGSNGRVAWGFTAARIDTMDLVVLEPLADDRYQGSTGPQTFDRETETIQVKGQAPVELPLQLSEWGPIVDHDHHGRPLALCWTALEDSAFNLEHLRFDKVPSLEAALHLANRVAMPTQNFVAVDDQGRVGWTLIGLIPSRLGYDGFVPQLHHPEEVSWQGLLEPNAYPRIVDPERGYLWSANHRHLGGPQAALLGDGGYDVAARAHQIRAALADRPSTNEVDMLSLQLETHAPFYQRWRSLLRATLQQADRSANSRWQELAEVVADDQSQFAAMDSAGFRLVRSFRLDVAETLLDGLTAACREVDEDFDFFQNNQYESALWELVRQRPDHLLPSEYKDWPSMFAACVDKTLSWFPEQAGALGEQTWGKRNIAEINHPLGAIPLLGRWLNMPAQPLPGDTHAPLYQSESYGPSSRMVVSPGQETRGIFHMPGGQSGHPYSPFYRAGHENWAQGKASPFLPGPDLHRLTLRPDSSQ